MEHSQKVQNSRITIKNSLHTYLKSKNYAINERFRRSDLVLTQSREDFMMDLKIKNEISRTNSFSYSNISSLNSNTSPVDQQFTKLMAFVQQEKRPVVHQELEKLLPPLLCHLYIEMLKGKDWKPAHDFLRKYSVLLGPIDAKSQQKFNGNDTQIPSPIVFTSNVLNNQNSHLKPPPPLPPLSSSSPSPPPLQLATDDNEKRVKMFKELIEHLSTLQRIEDCESNRDIVMFRSCKYEVKLSNQALASLNKFLAKHGHVLILQLLHVWFSMDLYQLKDDMNEIDDDQLSTSSSSSSDSIINFSEYNSSNYNVVKQKSTNRDHRSTGAVVTKFDQLNCDNQKDISNSRLHSFSSNNNEQQQNYEECNDGANNLKLKRLQSCLNQVNSKYHMPIRLFNINNTDNSLCSVNLDKSMCHLAAGFEDSTIMLWSLNGYENYGRKPYQMFDDRLCKWSINNCNRYLTDDLSDYSSDDDELSINNSKGEKNSISKCFFSSNSQSVVLRGHRSAVTDLMFGRKHDIMLSVSRDSTLRVWKADSYTCASVYRYVIIILIKRSLELLSNNNECVCRGHEYPIWCVDESSNGCYAATGSRDSTARLWNYERKFPVKTFVGHTQDVECIAFHPNGVYIATGSTDTTIRMWCVVSGKLLRIFTECHLPVNAISFSPDGKMLAAAGDETKIRIFDLAAGQQLADLKNHTAPVKSLSWSSNSKKLLSGCTDGNFYVWNINYLGLSESSSSKSTPANQTSSNSATNSTNSSTLLQMSNTGSKRILKVRFDKDNDLIHMIGND
ncbi:unnamed protein product [Diamesa serratosioi]